MPVEPMIKLDAGGKAPVLSYNVPEPTSYSGKNLIELKLPGKDEDYFIAQPIKLYQYMSKDELKAKFIADFKIGYFDPAYAHADLKNNYLKLKFVNDDPTKGHSNSIQTFAAIGTYNPYLKMLVSESSPTDNGSQAQQTKLDYYFDSDLPLLDRLRFLDLNELIEWVSKGYRINIFKTLSGSLTYNYIKVPVIRPRILLVESYKLSSFLGNYGAGRVIKTFSLLPGEKTKISVKTYKKTETEAKQASSILDSYSDESAQDFENSIQMEQSSKTTSNDSFEYHADVNASASWGWGNASVNAGVKGSSNSSREETGKNTTNAVAKHSAKASSKRDININTESSVKTSIGEETETIREIENINVSRTLNFIFRQMNQEFISLLHLTDVRVAFFNGNSDRSIEVTLPQLDSLLNQVIVPGKISEVKQIILNEILSITDHKGDVPTRVKATSDGAHIKYERLSTPFIEEKYLLDMEGNKKNDTKYYQFSRDALSLYTDETNNQIVVPGIIISSVKNVMRTDGVIVDAIIGQGDALDSYSHGLQDEAVRERKLANDMKENELNKQALLQSILASKDEASAKLVSEIYPPKTKETRQEDDDN